MLNKRHSHKCQTVGSNLIYPLHNLIRVVFSIVWGKSDQKGIFFFALKFAFNLRVIHNGEQ